MHKPNQNKFQNIHPKILVIVLDVENQITTIKYGQPFFHAFYSHLLSPIHFVIL